jgi:hypothetical protein
MPERTVARMGWRPDLPDYRDHLFQAKLAPALAPTYPPTAQVPRFQNQPVFDQGYLGSCTANAIATVFQFERNVAPRSRLQLYYEERRIIGETDQDNGAYLRDGVRVASTLGAGREVWWPYDTTRFAEDPPLTVDRDALKRRIFRYTRLLTRDDFRLCIASGHPFVIGFTVYDFFLSPLADDFGIIPLPRSGERQQGGHAVAVYGYESNFGRTAWADQARAQGMTLIPEDVYLCRNSWGYWGNAGNFAIDAAYLENPGLAGDAWTLRTV